MTDRVELSAESIVSLPPILRSEYESAPIARGPWLATIGPAFLGLFVWAPFFDVLWASDVARFALPWLIARASVATLLCYTFYYLAPAIWGWRTGRPAGIVAASTFGAVGSEWITGIAVAVASIVWYAVALDYGIESTLIGLRTCGLLPANALNHWSIGPVVIKSPVYLLTALFWIYITGTSSLWNITGVVSALMKVYAPIALFLLTAVALAMLPELGGFQLEDARRIAEDAGVVGSDGRGSSTTSVIQLITGFFAMSGLASVDWGARAQTRRDVLLGGLIGIVVAASWTATMALLVVAGSVSKISRVGIDWRQSGVDLAPLSFRWGVFHAIGGIPAGIIFILFGLAALAPACYSAWVFGQKLSTHWPQPGRNAWTWFCGAAALAIAATGHANRLDQIYSAMGDIFAPALGAVAADFLIRRGQWSAVGPAVNRAGLIAWVAGMGAAGGLDVWQRVARGSFGWCESTSIWGFLLAACVHFALGSSFLRSRALGRTTVTVGPIIDRGL